MCLKFAINMPSLVGVGFCTQPGIQNCQICVCVFVRQCFDAVGWAAGRASGL